MDDRLAQHTQECDDLAKAIEDAIRGQYADKPPSLLAGWSKRAAAAVICAGWLPPWVVAQMLATEIEQDTLKALANTPLNLRAATPEVLSRYVAAHGWTLDAREVGVREVWSLPRFNARMMIPLATDYIDFDRRWADALDVVKVVYRWDDETMAIALAPYRT